MKILITGGTGTFGKAMTKRLLLDNHQVIIYSRDELKQHEMRNNFKSNNISFEIGDIRDKNRLKKVANQYRPTNIIHAAALKQVPVGEENPSEVIKTNILGSKNVVEIAELAKGKINITLISSDKAVNPINLYGSTKLCAEKLFMAVKHPDVISNIVRYGNVVGSRGSVVPVFKKMASEGCVLKITHPEMTRFWITIDQATKLVMEAISSLQSNIIYIPKIPSIKITDLAEAIKPGCKFTTTGIRPGEKLHEVLISNDEYMHLYEKDEYYMITKDEYAHYDAVPNAKPFEYTSNTNKHYLTIDELRGLL